MSFVSLRWRWREGRLDCRAFINFLLTCNYTTEIISLPTLIHCFDVRFNASSSERNDSILKNRFHFPLDNLSFRERVTREKVSCSFSIHAVTTHKTLIHSHHLLFLTFFLLLTEAGVGISSLVLHPFLPSSSSLSLNQKNFSYLSNLRMPSIGWCDHTEHEPNQVFE